MKDKSTIDTRVEAWKANNPGVKIGKLEIEIGEKTIVGYFQEANRFVVGAVLAQQGRDQIQGAKTWIDSCLIQELSDPEFLQDDKDILLTCVKYSQSIAEVKKSSMTSV